MHKTPNQLPCDGELYLIPDFFDATEAGQLYQQLYENIQWQQRDVRVFGQIHPQPRLVAWHGDAGLSYTYSGLRLEASPWTPLLLQIKDKLEARVERPFNSVLLNLYRDQKDSNGWHSDDEKELGENPTIASLSFGETRDFLLRHKRAKHRLKIPLSGGSLLVMAGSLQSHWQHSLPKRQRPLRPRINLTFRYITPAKAH